MTRSTRFAAAVASLSGTAADFRAWEADQFNDEVAAARAEPRREPPARPVSPPATEPKTSASPAVALPDAQLWNGLERALAALMDGAGNFTLLPCEVDGAPAGLVVCYRLTGNGMEVAPLFVSVTPAMQIRGKDGDHLYGKPEPD